MNEHEEPCISIEADFVRKCSEEPLVLRGDVCRGSEAHLKLLPHDAEVDAEICEADERLPQEGREPSSRFYVARPAGLEPATPGTPLAVAEGQGQAGLTDDHRRS
jgi:hypothetical protein